MEDDIDFMAADYVGNLELRKAHFGLMKHFNATDSDDEILVTVRADIETLNRLIDPLFR